MIHTYIDELRDAIACAKDNIDSESVVELHNLVRVSERVLALLTRERMCINQNVCMRYLEYPTRFLIVHSPDEIKNDGLFYAVPKDADERLLKAVCEWISEVLSGCFQNPAGMRFGKISTTDFSDRYLGGTAFDAMTLHLPHPPT